MSWKDWLKSAERKKMESLVIEFRYQLTILEMTYHNVKTSKEVRQYIKGQRDQLQTILYDIEEILDLPHDRKPVASASDKQKLLAGFKAE
jgi:hypothetical protein